MLLALIMIVTSVESFVAFVTLKEFHSEVSPLVILAISFGNEFLCAESTLKVLLTCVLLYMVFKAASLFQVLTTFLKWALGLTWIVQQFIEIYIC
jgi:hypothetical protein